jgi:hypothetical protein
MDIEQRIRAFAILGDFLRQWDAPLPSANEKGGALKEEYAGAFKETILLARQHNGWFTEANVNKAVGAIAEMLTEEKLKEWVSHYPIKNEPLKRVGVIMAGNIPLVGFHDFLCILISGNIVVAKLSSDDKLLLPLLAKILVAIEPDFMDRVHFTEGRLDNIDTIIATGSNNSARYFEYYFGKYPHIIRKNRNGVAVLDGTETKEELELLGEDVFGYFGLGCRNVSKVYLPVGFDLDRLFGAFFKFKPVLDNNKYGNNYDYNRAIYLMSQVPLLENGFVLFKEDKEIASPVAVLFYEYYNSPATVKAIVEKRKDEIQCVIGHTSLIPSAFPFGSAQYPSLSDYADGVDTLKFLTD